MKRNRHDKVRRAFLYEDSIDEKEIPVDFCFNDHIIDYSEDSPQSQKYFYTQYPNPKEL
jgi:hypothetical protein